MFLQNITCVLSPLLAALVTYLPVIVVSGRSVLNSFTWCGIICVMANGIAILVVRLWFTEPQNNSHFEGSFADFTRNILFSKAWISCLISFQNNFNQTVVLWGLPLITKTAFGWEHQQNGYTLAALGALGAIATCFSIYLSHFLHDRFILLIFQMFVGLGLVLITFRASDEELKLGYYIVAVAI